TLTDALRRPEVVSLQLGPLHEANKALLQAVEKLNKSLPRKRQTPPVRHHEEDAIRLDFVSDHPPSLRQDPDDLYNRFPSGVLLRLSTLDKDGQVISSIWETTIPVAADPQLRWRFPSQQEALAAIAHVFDDAAKGRLEMAKNFYDQLDRIKRLEGRKK